jgi:hypothetical protein
MQMRSRASLPSKRSLISAMASTVADCHEISLFCFLFDFGFVIKRCLAYSEALSSGQRSNIEEINEMPYAAFSIFERNYRQIR